MNKTGLAIHGGAGPDSGFIKKHKGEYEHSLQSILSEGYKILSKGGTALEAVYACVVMLEDDPLFNAGRGAALNNHGEIEMDASIMDGKKLKAGAVSLIKNVRNPVQIARFVMEKTLHVHISDSGAQEIAKDANIKLEPESYFITEHQVNDFLKERDEKEVQNMLHKRIHGTVGAVALDKNGNVASATSTGGTPNCLAGRIGDSCMIGAGCYANNKTCAVSGTGDGELLIVRVIAHAVAAALEYKGCTMQEACDYILHDKNSDSDGDIGVISIDTSGNFGISFNSERMHRAWIGTDLPMQVGIYR